MADTSNSNRPPLIEQHSIKPIPEKDRHGSLLSQFTLWFSANLHITATITGALAVVLGGDVFWSLIGLFVGQLLGGCIMALHAAQGPKLGIPQMISSRAQFGFYGAAIPLVLACLMYIGLTATGTLLSGQAISSLLGTGTSSGVLIFALVVLIVTVVGYRLIHSLGQVTMVISVIAFVYLLVKIMILGSHEGLLSYRHFTAPSFLLAMSLSASWQIAYGPYVADYSRYMPTNTSSTGIFVAVGAGSIIGGQLAMTLGVFAAQLGQDSFNGHEVSYIVGLGGSGAIAALLYLSIALGKVTITVLNAYGSFMCTSTMLGAFKRNLEIPPKHRFFFVLGMLAISVALALFGQHSFLPAFASLILFLLAFFTPWSAINLADYYLVSGKHCDVSALDDPSGRYGRWNLTGIGVYIIGVVVQIPFISTAFYTGPLVPYLHGADISWMLGLIIPAALYLVLSKLTKHSAS